MGKIFEIDGSTYTEEELIDICVNNCLALRSILSMKMESLNFVDRTRMVICSFL